MNKYEAAAGATFNNKQAQVIGEILEGMGEFTPADVVEAARPKKSPMHNCFEWDDTKAAEAHRLNQARHMVQRIRVVVKTERSDARPVKAYHSVVVMADDGQSGTRRYVSTATISHDTDLSEQVVVQARCELETWKKKYEECRTVFGGVFDAIEVMK